MTHTDDTNDLDRLRIQRESPRTHDPRRAPPPPSPWLGYVTAPAVCYPGYFLDLWAYDVGGATTTGYVPEFDTGYGPSQSVCFLGLGYAYFGDVLISESVGSRWASQKFPFNPTYNIPGCPCTTIPGTLYLKVQQSAPVGPENLVMPATLKYGTKPSPLAAYNSDAVGYYSTKSYSTPDGLYVFWYWFGCNSGLYFLQILYDPSSPIGYPGRGFVMSWLAGLTGNTCAPFSMVLGATNSPVYQSQGISITAAS